jgi:hypothetical protein
MFGSDRTTHAAAATHPSLSGPWLVAAGVAFAANLFLHLPVTDLFDAIAARVGFRRYDHLLAVAFALLGAAAVIVVSLRRERRRPLLVATVLLVAAAGLAHAFLLVASIEDIHFPQYALLAFLLGRSRIPAEASWLGATALGGVDEAYQFLVLRRGTPTYLDWNDIVLNALGAVFGIILLLVVSHGATARRLCTARTLAVTATATVLGALVFAPPIALPFFRPNATGGHYHVLSPFEGLLLIAAIWIGIRQLLQRVPEEP